MAQRVKCYNIGCELCQKGKLLNKTVLGKSVYYCKAKKKAITRKNAKECMNFRCKAQNQYFCKTCNGGRKVGK